MRLVVGLGNPGKQYEQTRHNLGFLAIDRLGDLHDIALAKQKFSSFYGQGQVHGEKVLLIKPQTYMNLSGTAVRQFVDYFNINVTDLILLHDELDVPAGKIKINRGSGAGGHKGVASVIERLGSKEFTRIRIGISRPDEGVPGESWVLTGIKPEEGVRVEQSIKNAVRAVEEIILNGINKAQELFHRRERKHCEEVGN